jgi:putative transposase
MSHRKSYNTPGHVHFLTFSCWQQLQFLRRSETCLEFARALDRARSTEQFDLWAYVIMPEHVHLLICPRQESYDMARILRRIKESFSRQILNDWRQHYPERLEAAADTTEGPVRYRFWQPGGGFDRNLYDHDAIRNAVVYIEANPIRRGLVGNILDWEWSSTRARVGWTDVPLRVDPIAWELTPIESGS